jgi:hypothetical protein
MGKSKLLILTSLFLTQIANAQCIGTSPLTTTAEAPN